MKLCTVLIACLGLAAGAARAQQPASEAPVYSVVEPKPPAKAKPAAKKRAAKANARAMAKAKAKPAATTVAELERPKPSGPCVVKPVMSDQDLVNCGATPQH